MASNNMINQNQSGKRDANLERLGALVGEWEMTSTQFPQVHGRMAFSWLEDGSFLVQRAGSLPSPFPSSSSIFGSDDVNEVISMLYHDSRGVSRVYQTTIDDHTWKIWRDAPGFSQRFTGIIGEDGNTINADWEKSLDGEHWEHDFDLKYTRVASSPVESLGTHRSSGVRGEYAPVNGLNLYYETYGSRGTKPPLILLHGGLGLTGMYAELLPAMSQNRQVIAVDLQGHGHSADIDRPFSFESMADDIAALIRYLGLSNVDIAGYSLGGGVALQTTIHHPDLIRKLVLISTPCKQAGWYPEVLVGMAAMNAEAAQGMVGSPPHAAYVGVAPKPEDWPLLVSKTGELLKQDYNWCAEFAKIQAPVQLVFADADSIRPEHMVEMFQLLGGGKSDAGWDGSNRPKSRLAVLPGTTHYDIITSPLLPSLAAQFLDES